MSRNSIKKNNKLKHLDKAKLNDRKTRKLGKRIYSDIDVTVKSLHGPLGSERTNMIITGKVAYQVKSLDSLGIKIKRPNKMFSNAVPHGYTRREWNEQLKKLK